MIRIWAIIERDLRRYRRSPALMAMSLVMPLVQLVFLGYAFGGQVRNLRLGLVDQDRALPALRLHEMFQAIGANAKTFQAISYPDMGAAMQDLRNGHLNGVLNIPPEFSRDVHARAHPRLALIEDNTDQFSSGALGGSLQQVMSAYDDRAVITPRLATQATLSIVELYPYVPYIQFLLPGTIVLAIFVSAMIGGGIIFIDDKARGLHEGYLVTPIKKLELILGFTLAGVIKAVISGLVLVTIGSLIAGIHDPFNVFRLARLFVMVVATAFALICMMFLIVVRVNDPLLPRAVFGMLNTVLFFPSGAVYPISAFPAWMRAMTKVNPFTYAVHGFKEILLKNNDLYAIRYDILFLVCFTLVTVTIATRLFRRTL